MCAVGMVVGAAPRESGRGPEAPVYSRVHSLARGLRGGFPGSMTCRFASSSGWRSCYGSLLSHCCRRSRDDGYRYIWDGVMTTQGSEPLRGVAVERSIRGVA